MPTFNPLHKLESSIIELIASHQGLTIKDLHEQINRQGSIVSFNGLYKPVNRMLESQMIVKTGGQLFINHVWLRHLMQFASTAEKNHLLSRSSDLKFPLKEGQRYEFSADSLQGLDSVWNHILTKLSGIIKDKWWYVYDSHPWYPLGMRDTEHRLYEGVISQKKGIYMLFGNTNFLDTYGAHLIQMPNYHTRLTDTPPFLKEGHALWVGDDYIVECIFPDLISRNFSFFFDSITDISEFNPKLFADIFKMKSSCKVSVRRDKNQAKRLKQIFEPFFDSISNEVFE